MAAGTSPVGTRSDAAEPPGGWPSLDWEPYHQWRDWRYWVGLVGKVLVVTGLLMLAFVAYQLWGTGIQHARAQDRLESEFEDLLAQSPSTTPTTAVAPTTAPTGSVAPTTTVPPTTTTVPQVPIPTEPGQAVARLRIPSIGLDQIVVAGVGTEELKKGPGHYPDTPLPGQDGNVAIAGHRTTYGAPFIDIDQVQVGDEIILTTTTGDFVYRMTSQQIVSPSDYGVIGPTGAPTITLTSCHPKYSARERIVVQGAFDPAASTGALAPPTPNYLANPPVPGENTVATTPAPTPPPTTAATSVATTAGTTAVTTLAPPTAPPTTAALGASGSAEALEQGWFDDAAAWPQVILWGLVVLAVVLGARWVGRATRHRWIGWTVGAIPFVVTLYFWFENVNRLLPPNI